MIKITEAVARSARAVAAFVRHCPDIDAAEATVAAAIMQERERCAMLVEQNMLCEGDGGEVLRPRSNACNRIGMAYADAIRRGDR